jgi:hypothetical protein
MPYVQGFLRIRGGSHPDNELPGDQPGIDNSLPGNQPGIDNELPPAPPGIWPPPTISNPIVPIIDNTLPVAPGTIWPPVHPARPDQGLPTPRPPIGTGPGTPARPDQGLPAGGGVPSHPIAPHVYWMLCYTPNHGWKFVAVDPSLHPGNALPPHAQPK